MKIALKNTLRNIKTLIIVAMVATISTVFIMTFGHSITLHEEELAMSYEQFEVKAYVTGATANAVPKLSIADAEKITSSGFVAQFGLMAEYKLSKYEILRGVNNIKIDPSLERFLTSVVWKEGYDVSIFEGCELVCLVPAGINVLPGEQIEVSIYGETIPLIVAGTYGSGRQSAFDVNIYYCPVATLKKICMDYGEEFTYCAMEMILCNLPQLDLFKAQMSEVGLNRGSARIIINDAQMQKITGEMQHQIVIMKVIFSVLLMIVSAIAFIISVLLLRGRRREAAVMRSLGVSQVRIMYIFVIEGCIQTSLGVLFGGMLVMTFWESMTLQARYILLVWFSFIIGDLLAALKISSVNVFTAMTEKE